MSTRGLLFQWASTINIQQSVLVKHKADLIIISLKINLFSPWYSCKINELALNNNHSLTVIYYTKIERKQCWMFAGTTVSSNQTDLFKRCHDKDHRSSFFLLMSYSLYIYIKKKIAGRFHNILHRSTIPPISTTTTTSHLKSLNKQKRQLQLALDIQFLLSWNGNK
jgi:hypothetical protein